MWYIQYSVLYFDVYEPTVKFRQLKKLHVTFFQTKGMLINFILGEQKSNYLHISIKFNTTFKIDGTWYKGLP